MSKGLKGKSLIENQWNGMIKFVKKNTDIRQGKENSKLNSGEPGMKNKYDSNGG